MQKDKKYKAPNKAKSAILQYCAVGLICLPILIVLAFWFEKIKFNSALSILIYCCIILFAWFIWLLIRRSLEKRAEKIRLMRKAADEKMQKVLAEENKRAKEEVRNLKNKKGKINKKILHMDKPFDAAVLDLNNSNTSVNKESNNTSDENIKTTNVQVMKKGGKNNAR